MTPLIWATASRLSGSQLSPERSSLYRCIITVPSTGLLLKLPNSDQEILLTENQSTYIPIGVVHRLAFFQKMPANLTLN